MTEVQPITDDAGYRRTQARIHSMMNVRPKDEQEAEELRLLTDELVRYAETRFEIYKDGGDGADEIEFMLDQGVMTLDELLPVVGGMQPLVDYMTRRRNLDPATIDAIVSKFDTQREWIDKPFCKPPGWQDITLENVECCDEDPCPVGIPEWRERLRAYRERTLTGISRITQDVGDSSADSRVML